jgi:hypothetical protein
MHYGGDGVKLKRSSRVNVQGAVRGKLSHAEEFSFYKLRAFAAILCAYGNEICSSAYQHRGYTPRQEQTTLFISTLADAAPGKQKGLYTLD